MDKRLGKRTLDGVEFYPEQYASGGAFVNNRSPITFVDVGNGFFYVLSVGRGLAPDGVHEELVAIANAGQQELPLSYSENTETLPFSAEFPVEVEAPVADVLVEGVPVESAPELPFEAGFIEAPADVLSEFHVEVDAPVEKSRRKKSEDE